MSNQRLLHQMVLDSDRFFQRLKRLYDAWKSPETVLENDNMSNVDCIMVAVGDDNGSGMNKSVALHLWLFGYELNNTICLFTRDTVHILSGKKEIEFLKRIENRMEMDGNGPAIELLDRDRSYNDGEHFNKLLNIMTSHNKIGVFGDDGFPGKFCESWQETMAAYNFQTTNIAASIAYFMAVKEECELTAIKEACHVTVDVFEKYLKQNVLEIMKANSRVKHSQLAKGIEYALCDKQIVSDADMTQLSLCYPPIIQSGGNYELKFGANSDQNYLDFGVIVCSLGVRYKSYCSNISRTWMIEPSKTVQSNYDFLQQLENELLKTLVPGARLNEVHSSVLEYAKKKKPDLADHLTETFGSAIGIEFNECSLSIGPKCTAVVKKDMVFNVCIGLHGLTDSDASDAEKPYALFYSDTVIVNEFGLASCLTSPPPYLKVNADCWEHIFDYLPFKDILAMERTCIRMHQMAGYYIRENFADLPYTMEGRKITVEYSDQKFTTPSIFWGYIAVLRIRGYIDFHLDAGTFSSLKTLIFDEIRLDEIQLGYLQNVLKNVQNILIVDCEIELNTFEQLSNYCPNLKCLKIYWCENHCSTLFSQNYPSLERLTYAPRYSGEIYGIGKFLESHANLKHFKCERYLLSSLTSIEQQITLFNPTNVHLDVLEIKVLINESALPGRLNGIFDILKHLYDCGFYKKLNLLLVHEEDINFELLNNTIFTLPALEKLDIVPHEYNEILPHFKLSRAVKVKELVFRAQITELDISAENLIKLERVTFSVASIENILPFICHFKRLKTIKIFAYNSDDDLDLVALNQERKKLGEDVAQVLIYVPEDLYLRIKNNSKNANLSHVKIARLEKAAWQDYEFD